MTENQTDLQPTKEKQEKALTLFCVRAQSVEKVQLMLGFFYYP